MYAVIQTGGKQYKVAKDDILVVEKLAGEAGDTVELDSVLLLGDGGKTTAGSPFVEGATVAAEVVQQTRGEKIIVFKKQRRKGHRRRNGHRQHLTVLKVTEILTDGKKPAKAAKPKAAAPAKAEAAKPAAEAEAKAPEAPKKAETKAEAPKKPAVKKAETAKAKAEKSETKKAAPKKTSAAKKPAAKKTAAKKTEKKEE